MISLTIDGLPASATPGMTVLEAADKAGISIPRLCPTSYLQAAFVQVEALAFPANSR